MGLIKDIYSPAFYKKFAGIAAEVLPTLDHKTFSRQVFTPAFAQMEWKDRMKHTTQVLHRYMPPRYADAAGKITELIGALRKNGWNGGLEFMFLPDYIETYGLDDLKNSIKALEHATQFISCEFAVRPFIARYPNEMLAQMLKWSSHRSEHVRRLASEGSRPRLPWAMALPALKKNPAPLLPLLEALKNDPSEYVRRSVANHLNDIAKDHPDTVIRLASRWKGISKETDAIVKHGCRTLLKQGHPKVLKLYGLDSRNIEVKSLQVLTPLVKVGQHLSFSFELHNKSSKKQEVRLEYGIYYKKAKGHLAKKVFKITERVLAPGEKSSIVRQQSFRPITTRVFHPGNHEVSVIVNGEEKKKGHFELRS